MFYFILFTILRISDSPQPSDGLNNIIMGDSWFQSVKTVAELQRRGHESVGPVKTAHSGYPKDFMNEHLKDLPGGVKLVMKGTHPSGGELIATGYKYTSGKVLTFVSSAKAGSTTNGDPYELRYLNMRYVYIFTYFIN